VELNTEQSLSSMAESIVSEYVFLDQEEEVSTTKSVEEESSALKMLNEGEITSSESTKSENERQPKNGAEAYENLVKSLTECDADYISADAPIGENFGLIHENSILEEFSTFSRDTGLF
jgi:hypothetical protein